VDNPVNGVDHEEEDEASELSLSSKVKAVKGQQAIVANSIAGYNYDPVDVKIARKKLLVRRLRSVIINTGMCVYICIYMYIYINVYICIFIYIYIYIYRHKYTQEVTSKETEKCDCDYKHRHIHYIYAYINMYVQIRM
jgi:hypothetical protein